MTPAFRMRKLRKNYQKIVRTVSEKEEKPGQCDVLQSQVKKKMFHVRSSGQLMIGKMK